MFSPYDAMTQEEYDFSCEVILDDEPVTVRIVKVILANDIETVTFEIVGEQATVTERNRYETWGRRKKVAVEAARATYRSLVRRGYYQW